MRFVLPSVEMMNVSGDICDIERAGRVCYKSEDRIGPDTALPFVRGLIARGHEAVLEHVSATVRIICDRGVSHEIVRHRLASYCQESTRYVNYQGERMEFVLPHWLLKPNDPNTYGYMLSQVSEIGMQDIAERYGEYSTEWYYFNGLATAEQAYNVLVLDKWAPQDARAILPNALKTEIVMTANLREWRHFLKLRMSSKAHPDMRIIADKCYNQFMLDGLRLSVVFEDLAPIVTGELK